MTDTRGDLPKELDPQLLEALHQTFRNYLHEKKAITGDKVIMTLLMFVSFEFRYALMYSDFSPEEVMCDILKIFQDILVQIIKKEKESQH